MKDILYSVAWDLDWGSGHQFNPHQERIWYVDQGYNSLEKPKVWAIKAITNILIQTFNKLNNVYDMLQIGGNDY